MGKRGFVMGIDASLTNTRAVVLPAAWDGDWDDALVVAAGSSLAATATVAQRIERCIDIADALEGRARQFHVKHFAIENYGFSRANRSHHLGELGGILRARLLPLGQVTEVVASKARAQLLGRRGNGGKIKDRVQTAWRAAGFPFADDLDACDAMTVLNWWLAENSAPRCFVNAGEYAP